MRLFLCTAALVTAAASTLADSKAALPAETRPQSAPSLKGVVTDRFVVSDIPAGTQKVRAWFELPLEEPLQEITDLKVSAPDGHRITKDAVLGNRFLYVEIENPKATGFEVTVTFGITRWESQPSGDAARALTAAEKAAAAPYLAEFPNGETTEKIREAAKKLSDGSSDPTVIARKFYDYIIDNAEYWKKDPDHLKPSGKGSATYCMDSKTGNCTDFHALYQAMARAVDLPTQFVMGTALKKDLDGVEKFEGDKKEPSYHCWVKTWFPGRGWVYSDISYADSDLAKKEYYFDRIDVQRVGFANGRNIDLEPKQDGPRLNWFIKCYVETDGKEHSKWDRQLSWKSVK